MKMKEIEQKAENLISVGNEARSRYQSCQRQFSNAQVELQTAYLRLESASQLDENGSPVGDIASARADIIRAQALLNAARQGMETQASRIEQINKQKNEAIKEIDEYNSAELKNLEKLQKLMGMRFGGNLKAAISDLINRMNSGEAAKANLQKSLGINSSKKNFGAGLPTGLGTSGDALLGNQYFNSNSTSQEEHWIDKEYSYKVGMIYNFPHLNLYEKAGAVEALRNIYYNSNDDFCRQKAKVLVADSINSAELEERDRYNQELARILTDFDKSVQEKDLEIQLLRQSVDASIWTGDSGVAYDVYGNRLGASPILSPVQKKFGSGNRNSSYQGIKKSVSSVDKTTIENYKSDEVKRKIQNHKYYSGVDIFQDKKMYVFSMNNAAIKSLHYSQGNNDLGWRMVCGLAASAGVCQIAGLSITENDMVHYARNRKLCESNHIFRTSINGATTGEQIATLLSEHGIPSHYDYSINVEEVADIIEEGRGVIAGVNAGSLWNSYYGSAYGQGEANHAISVLGTARDINTHELVGFYVNDTGRGYQADRQRFVSINKFKEIYEVPGHVIVATDNAIK